MSAGLSAGSAGAPSRAFMSIGEVLSQLRADFPDITISKIRFLEAEGLVEPERTSSGYRKFSREDLSRLRYVLSAQRDHYLPLRVIKEHLDAIDRGLEPPALGGSGPKVPRALVAAEGLPGPDAFLPEVSEIRLSKRELLDAAGLQPEQLEQLEQYGLLGPRSGGSHYDGNALIVAKTVAEMARFGIEARHLRPFKAAAEREIGLVEQVVTPLVRQRNPEARARADEVARELAALSVKLHATLVRAGLGPGLRR
ncbi:MAG: transcriptional regulator, MerR family [uncultured Friedmanniella sp.]|uniref:Transcriptional regulator, MerR family n=1 Tax=uncultured Friedmanniella sp. TaxID=335381 RepID=A0A6J4L323_9ACTN|nr:MAG: transcriptional regulator, MerR family [uncultured Friedmanniella sp.]